MTIYNVRQSVVALVEADSPDAAILKLRHKLDEAGFEHYTDEYDESIGVFESEPIEPGAGIIQ